MYMRGSDWSDRDSPFRANRKRRWIPTETKGWSPWKTPSPVASLCCIQDTFTGASSRNSDEVSSFVSDWSITHSPKLFGASFCLKDWRNQFYVLYRKGLGRLPYLPYLMMVEVALEFVRNSKFHEKRKWDSWFTSDWTLSTLTYRLLEVKDTRMFEPIAASPPPALSSSPRPPPPSSTLLSLLLLPFLITSKTTSHPYCPVFAVYRNHTRWKCVE